MTPTQRRRKHAWLTLVIGGASSGKSAFALSLAGSATSKAFIATGEPLDAEMADRIRRHQHSRGPGWETAEVPVTVANWVKEKGARYGVIVLDCLTLWISNLVGRGGSSKAVLDQVAILLSAVRQASTKMIIVTNELGLGLVPADPAVRAFRQLAGEVNQLVGREADEVYAVIGGLPVRIKPGRATRRRKRAT